MGLGSLLMFSALEFGKFVNDVGIIGWGNICRCASTFNFVSATLGGAPQNDKVEKTVKFGGLDFQG